MVQVESVGKTPNTSPEEFEMIVRASQIRSRRIRIVTMALLLALTCVGIYVVVRQHEAEVRVRNAQREAKEAREQAERARAIQQRLEEQSKRSNLASGYIASGAEKAGRGNFKGALADYDKALAIDPNNAGALSLEGYLRLRMGDSQKAESLLQKAVQNEPDQAWHRYNLALALWTNGKHDEAMAQLQEVVRLNPNFKQTIATDPQFRKFQTDSRFRKWLKL